ncbi:MAG: hypothetical protein IJK47_08705 [Lachnospiraceae bacterium]|nr:hypothetical protein [Lachnospiraceae bacterium]
MPSDNKQTLRHLEDLYRRAEKQNTYLYSAFLTPAEQAAFLAAAPKGGISYRLEGGAAAAERRLIIFGSEEDFGYPPEPPLCVLSIRPASEKFAEALTHRDYLGAVLALDIERENVGDIIVKEKEAYLICLERIADYLCDNLTEVRRTKVRVKREEGEIPALSPTFKEEQLNVASERLDAVIAAFCGLARGKAEALFAAEKVFVNSLPAKGGAQRLKEGDVFSVRGFGKGIYDGISKETKKGRYYVSVRRYV